MSSGSSDRSCGSNGRSRGMSSGSNDRSCGSSGRSRGRSSGRRIAVGAVVEVRSKSLQKYVGLKRQVVLGVRGSIV